MSTLTLDELKLKSSQANDLISKLQKQIEQVKLSTTPEYLAERAKKLQAENEQLRQKVEELKKELEEAESKRGTAPAPAAATTAQPTAAQAKPAAANPPSEKPKQEKPAKQQESKKQQTPAKKEEQLAPEDVNVSKLDIRIGKIVKCEKHPDADSLYVEQIDLGEGKLRNVCSGLVKFIPLEQMQDRLVVLLCNLKPNKLRGVMSEAMVLCASTPEKVELLEAPAGAQIGDRVTVAGYEGEPIAEINTKNNVFALVQPDLKTDDSLVATYKGIPLEIKGKGPLKSSTLKSVPIK